MLAAGVGSAGFSSSAGFTAVGFDAPNANAGTAAAAPVAAPAPLGLAAPKAKADAAAAGFVLLSDVVETSRFGDFFGAVSGAPNANAGFGAGSSSFAAGDACFLAAGAPNANAGFAAAAVDGLAWVVGFLIAAAAPKENAGASAFFASPDGFFPLLFGASIGLAAPNEKAGLVALGFGESAAAGIFIESPKLVIESPGLALPFGVGAGFRAADLLEAAAANSNVGICPLASFSRSPRGFVELPRGVALGSANVKLLPATMAAAGGLDDPLLGREERLVEIVFGTVKLSSDFVGDDDHSCFRAGDVSDFRFDAGVSRVDDPKENDAAPALFFSVDRADVGFWLLLGNILDPLEREELSTGEDFCGTFLTELSENTGGPSVELAAGAAGVTLSRAGGTTAERVTSRLPRRIPPARSRDESPEVDFAADVTARDFDRLVAGGDVILSSVSKIFRLVSAAAGTIAPDRSACGALRLSGR